jgi:hypothetical protein
MIRTIGPIARLRISLTVALAFVLVSASLSLAQTATPTLTPTPTATATPNTTIGPTALTIRALGSLVKSLDLGQATQPLQYERDYTFSAGTDANQGDILYQDTRTLAASTSEQLDFNGGALTDAFGDALSFTVLKVLIIYASPNNTNDVVVGGASSDGLASMFGAANNTVHIKPGGLLVLIAPNASGYTVTPSTGDLLQVANGSSGTPVTYDIVAIGV